MFVDSESRRCLIISVFVLAGLFMSGSVGAEEPFNYFFNDWNVVSLTDYTRGTRISTTNGLVISGDHERKEHEGDVTVRIKFGEKLSPLSRRQEKTNLDGWIPVIRFTAREGDMQYDFRIWATPLPTVKDWKAAYNWPTEGENFLTWIWVKVTNNGTGPFGAKLKFEQAGDYTKREHPVPMLAEALEFSWPRLDMGMRQEAVVRIPQYPIGGNPTFEDADPRVWLNRTIEYWEEKIKEAAVIEVPCDKATQALKASHVHQLFNSDHGIVHGGEGVYDCFWLRDCAYALMQLGEAGLNKNARMTADAFLNYAHESIGGRFDSTDELDGNGQGPWAIWQYYKITGDKDWLANAYPKLKKSAQWTMKARREDTKGSEFEGLLPGWRADGENRYHEKFHIVGYDFWNLRGMLCIADAARILGQKEDAETFAKEAELYRQTIDAQWKRTGYPYFPPTWEKNWDAPGSITTHWGNTEVLWPTALFEIDDPRISALIHHLRHEYGGGFVEGLKRWGVQSGEQKCLMNYLSAYTTLAELMRGNHEQVVEDFYWYLLHSTAANVFPEGIYYESRTSRSDAYPHVTGHAMYANFLRHMLLHERGGELHLFPAVPDWWLGEGEVVRIERAPTHFGEVNLKVRGMANGVEIEFDTPTREKPQKIILHLPQSRPLLKPLEGVDVAYRSDQKKRWDFPTVVELYRLGNTYVSLKDLIK
jgi:hypothetical protein